MSKAGGWLATPSGSLGPADGARLFATHHDLEGWPLGLV